MYNKKQQTLKKTLGILIPLLLSTIFADAQKVEKLHETIIFECNENINMPLGRFHIGSAITIETKISGPWAEDGGIYHIVSDWNSLPKVVYRAESSITSRLRFHAYIDPNSPAHIFLFASWEHLAPDDKTNFLKFSISSEATFNTSEIGVFEEATILEDLLILQSTTSTVGIGTPSTGPHKLAVEGSIGAREIKIQSGEWADFVFKDKYDLMSLKDVENFINQNSHLPNIPSESEVKKDGFFLGEMDAKLLRKIEELTLYTIEQEKKIQKLEEENKTLKQLSEQVMNIQAQLQKMQNQEK